MGERGAALPPPPVGAELIDFTIERQRHRRFVGREDVLAQLDEWLLGPGPGEAGWVVVTGGPGMGKSAALSAWLLRREAAGAAVPHHFVRRQLVDWNSPSGSRRRSRRCSRSCAIRRARPEGRHRPGFDLATAPPAGAPPCRRPLDRRLALAADLPLLPTSKPRRERARLPTRPFAPAGASPARPTVDQRPTVLVAHTAPVEL